jgi:hypothetical protein
MADEYNPDTFDWGEDAPGIDLNDVGPNIVDEAIMAALAAHEEAYGWRFLKRSDRKEGAGRLYRCKFYMPEHGRLFFEENFPGYTFIWDGALGHHDHPVSNLCNELNEIEMVENLISSGEQWIDLFGNGNRDRKYKRKCVNMYTLATSKDYIRYQNTGPSDVLFDMDKLCDPNGVYGKMNHITITQALYYLSMEQIGRIVNVHSKRRIHALVHRHSKTRGELNSGEQEYFVDGNGVVTQWNVATGEKYTHPTLEPLFHQFNAKTSHGGVAWTVRAAGGDSYIIEFVGCPNNLCTDFVNVQKLKEQSWEEYEYNNISVQKFLHWTWMSASTSQGRVQIEDLELFSTLRRYVAGKQRTPRLKTETANLARRLCNKNDIISIHGGGSSDIPVASMTDYVEVAFYVDMRSELNIALSFHRENSKMATVLNKYYAEGQLPRDFSVLTGAAVVSARTISEAANSVMESLTRAQDVRLGDYGEMPGYEDVRELIQNGADPGSTIPGPYWG